MTVSNHWKSNQHEMSVTIVAVFNPAGCFSCDGWLHRWYFIVCLPSYTVRWFPWVVRTTGTLGIHRWCSCFWYEELQCLHLGIEVYPEISFTITLALHCQLSSAFWLKLSSLQKLWLPMDFQLARNLSALSRAQNEIAEALLHIDCLSDYRNREIIMSAASSEATEQLVMSARTTLIQVQNILDAIQWRS